MMQYPLYDVKDCFLFSDLLESIRHNYGTYPAFRNREKIWTYSSFSDLVKRCASYFNAYRRRVFIIDISDSLYFAAVFFAIVISDNIAFLSTEDEYRSVKIEESYEKIDLDKAVSISCGPITDCINKTSPDNICTIVCSSGTTSQKKGVMLSQRNLLANTVGGMRCYSYNVGERYVNILPYSHLFGVVADLLGPLYSGGTICICNNKLRVFDDFKFYRPTCLNLPPAMVEAIYKVLVSTGSFEKATGGCLKKIMCAGAKFDEAMNGCFDRYGMHVFAAYGLTECSPCISINRDLFYKKDSVGMVLPCCKVKIVDGEIAVSGDNVMIGYCNAPEATASVLRDGWLYTGDLGYIDNDQFLYIHGRKSNLIVFEDGRKIFPEELEINLTSISGIREVLVSPTYHNKRTQMQITIVPECFGEEVAVNVKKVLNDLGILSLLYKIQIQQEPLQRNTLGKILRTHSVVKFDA